MEIGSTLLIWTLRAITSVFDVITFPFYALAMKPWLTKRRHREPKALLVENREGGLTYRSLTPFSKMHLELENRQLGTLDKVFTYAMSKNGTKKCLGTRHIIAEEDEVQPNGRKFKKYLLGDYIWKSYKEIDDIVTHLARGLTEIGLKPKDRMCIFAETRAEWLITAIAAFRLNLTIVTLYATLGDDAVIHGINETEVTHVITTHDLLQKFKTILLKCPMVQQIVYMEDSLKKTNVSGFKENVKIHSLCDIVDQGKSKKSLKSQPSTPTPFDIAIIMYTSGSTGTPKGVLLTHRNVFTAMLAFSDALGNIYESDVYIGFLPLAHVLELMCETICFVSGIPIGYSSALTLTDKSSKIKQGCKGDASILRPTVVASVPLILDRIFKGIQEKVESGSILKQKVFKFFYDYKIWWYARGFNTPLVNLIIFNKVRQLVGGKVRLIACGGAPLSPDTHEFIRTCLCCPVLQGYGLTETAACASVQIKADLSTGRIGAPLGCSLMKIVNWEEGNYLITDQPYPRGEILIGGLNVSIGYFKLPEATKEEFIESRNLRWFKTGDIAEVHPDGVFKIIDRKKDLVKLQQGEYISLGKVESEMKTCPLVDNICIYGDSTKLFVVAIVVPDPRHLEQLAEKLGRSITSYEELCRDPQVVKAVLKELQEHGTKCRLQKLELPRAVKLCPEPWTPDSGLVTAAFKLKRKNILDRYQADITQMYHSRSGQDEY